MLDSPLKATHRHTPSGKPVQMLGTVGQMARVKFPFELDVDRVPLTDLIPLSPDRDLSCFFSAAAYAARWK